MKTTLQYIGSGFITSLFFAFWVAGQSGYAQINIFEPCTNNTAVNPNIIISGDAYFTSGVNDPSGAGYLRLTEAANYQTGSVYINQSFPSTAGVVVEFEYWSWGPSTTKADGLSVFLFDGNFGPGTFAFGGFGAGLGYGELSSPYPVSSGLTGGYVAIGLDEFGNWRTNLNSFDTAPGVRNPNIAIRGRTVDHTPYLSGILMSTLPFILNFPANTSTRPDTSQYYRKFQVAVLYNASVGGYQVAVSVQTSVNGTMQRIINPYTMNTPPPSTLKVGLASGTGAQNANHEIRNLRITSPGDVRVKKTGASSVTSGNTTSYTVTIYNDSPIDLNGITFKDMLPTGFIPDAGTPSFNNGGNAGNTLVSGGYTGNVYDAVLNIKQNDSCIFTFSGKFNVAGDTTVTNTAIVKTPTGYTDTDVSNDTARVVTSVFGMPITPQALQYIACPGANVTLGVTAQSGVSFYWYSAQTGGTALNASSSNSYTATNVSPPQTFWVEPRIGSTVYGRTPITISLSESCGGTPVGCAVNGTLIFKEDFGGNNPNDPDRSTIPLPSGTTTYIFQPSGIPTDGGYSIMKQSSAAWYSPTWNSYTDHTYPSDTTRGYFMLITADNNPGMFYTLQINDLCGNSDLYFSAWIGNLMNRGAPFIDPNLHFVLQDALTLEILAEYLCGNIPHSVGPVWKQYGFKCKTVSSSVILSIYNNAPGGNGNDFVLDDIEVHLCSPPVTITVPSSSDTAVCLGSSVTLSGTYTDDGTFGNTLTYRWEYSLTGDISNPAAWTTKTTSTGTSPLNATYSIPFVSASDTGYYRLLVGSAASINQPNCRAASKPVRIDASASLLIPIYDTTCPNIAYSKHGFNIPASELDTSGTVEFRDTIPNPTGCDSVIVLYLNVVDEITLAIDAVICEGDTFQEDGFNASASGTYTQNLQNRFGCDSIVILNLIVALKDTVPIFDTICDGETYSQSGFNVSKSGIYTQNLQNRFGCDSLVELNLTVKPTPDIEIIALSDNFCDKDFVEIQILTNGDSFLWSTGSSENPITATKSGLYSATAFINDCEKTAEYTVEECPCELWLPNVFTPNNDGVNDSFFPVVRSNLASFSMHIYDRWGQIIYKTDSHTPWDGTNNGRFAAAGVYFCVISYSCANAPEKIVNKQGSITLVR